MRLTFKFISHRYYLEIIVLSSNSLLTASEKFPKYVSPRPNLHTKKKIELFIIWIFSHCIFFFHLFIHHQLLISIEPKKELANRTLTGTRTFYIPSPLCVHHWFSLSNRGHALMSLSCSNCCLCIRRPTEPIVVNEPFMRAGNTPAWMCRSATIFSSKRTSNVAPHKKKKVPQQCTKSVIL